MKIATWNINGIRARLPNVLAWLKTAQPDVALFQETKCQNEKFPTEEIEDLGFNIELNGQKSFNGVAILAKRPIEDVVRDLPGDPEDVQKRYIEATIDGVRVASLYLPNGNPVTTDKFPYKLGWMDRLYVRAGELLETEEAFVLAGDYNICPEDRDVYDPHGWRDDALCKLESRERFRMIEYLGLTEAYRALHPDDVAYSFWDYQAGAWRKNNGLRIDHLLLSPQAADRLEKCEIDKDVRGHEEGGAKASDHVPVWCELSAP
ncbi:MAG: exodeoxyribonuclease III [Proteobacteria bacterium]|nr:exodeoxyribonuclease III [Pseudomonadota bacterium]